MSRGLRIAAKRIAVAAALTVAGAASAAAEDVAIVLDASNSMWGQIDGVSKIEIAREVMGDIIDDFGVDTRLGLVAYGHRRQGDCGDIETVIQVGGADRQSFLETFNSLMPRGKTPLTDAVRHAAEMLRYRDTPSTVVLLSDGIETCNADPCAVAAELEQGGVAFTAHVIGFDLANEAEQAQLSCIAENTGGQFFAAANADELAEALGQAAQAVAKPEPTTPPKPEPEPEPAVTIDAPAEAIAGSAVEIAWTPTLNGRDYVTVVPADADPDAVGEYVRAERGSPATLVVPGQPGAYEVRYVTQEGRTTEGAAPIILIDGEVALDAPAEVAAGSAFEVGRDTTVNGRDYITIVAADAPEDEVGEYRRAEQGNPSRLVAPAMPGLYEVRYVLSQGRRTIGRAMVEVTDPSVTLDAPAEVTAGSPFEVTRDGTVNGRDYITIVPADAADDEIGEYRRAEQGDASRLVAPATPGVYKVRYVLSEGRRPIARTVVEVTEGSVTLEAPAEVTAGSPFEVAREGTINGRDYVTIVPADAADDEIGEYRRAEQGNPSRLVAPGTPGLYEVRYVLSEGRRTLARAIVEVVETEISLSAPDEVAAGSRFEVAREGTVNGRDYVTIVAADAPDDEIGEYRRAEQGNPSALVAPAVPGIYEVRYVLSEGRRTVARAMVEVVEASVTLDAPAEAMAGGAIPVSFAPTINGRDYVTLVPADAADDEIGEYKRADTGSPLELPAPDQPGLYEVRYVLSEGRRLIARAPVEVVAVSATLEGPGSVVAGSFFTVAWEGPNRRGDRIVLVPDGAPAEAAVLAEADPEAPVDPVRLQAPAEGGAYELRYMLGSTGEIVARDALAVEQLKAALDAVDSAAAGSTIEVGWTGPGNDRDRITLAPTGDSDMTWAAAARIADGNPVTLTVPDQPGAYELRYLDLSNRTVLVRRTLTVE